MKQSLFIFFLLYSTFAFSQDSYVTLNDQIIHGTIENYKEWSKNPTTVLFKDSTDGNSIYLTPANCKSFTADLSDKFTSYKGTRILNTDNVMYSHGLQSDQLEKDSVQVFLRQIYQFKNYTLYKLFDDKRTNFYLSHNGVIKELEYFENINNNQVVPFNGYKDYLLEEFSDKGIGGLQHKVDILAYKENDLINFFADVFGDKAHSSEKLRNKYSNEILIGIGANENFSSITNSRATYKQASTSPSFEIGLRIYNQRNFGRLFFQPSISVMSLSNTFNEGVDLITPYKTKATLVSVKLGAGYMFLKKSNISVYAAAAGALPVLFNYRTLVGTGKYVQSDGPYDKFTINPELGIIIKQTLNISFSGTLPFELPFLSDPSYVYKVSQSSIILRYAFIEGSKKK